MENRNDTPLIRTVGLKKYFHVPQGELHAVDDLSVATHSASSANLAAESQRWAACCYV